MKTNKILVAVLTVLCVAAVVGGVALYLNRGQPAAPAASTPFVPNLDPAAGDPQAAPTAEPIAPQSIRIPGYPSITIAANAETIAVNLMNPEGNPCYFTFALVLTETGETLYTSGMVEPGKAIREITLAHALAPGEHPATLQIATNALADGSPMNGANVETVLVAQ